MMEAARNHTREVAVGSVVIGGGNPVAVQSMTNTPTADVAATVAQIKALAQEGCEIVRCTVNTKEAAASFAEIVVASPIPVVADIHFDHNFALAALDAGAAAVRINPGNIGSWEAVDAVIERARNKGAAMRIGVNAGSLDRAYDERADLTLAQKMAASASDYVAHFEERGFTNVVLSAKAHDVQTTLEVNRALSAALPQVPLHLGVTEAGLLQQGTVKNSVALGILLNEGIGDTVRVSLTADPIEEPRVAWDILGALGMRRRTPELVSCPTCGRTQVNLIELASQVEVRMRAIAMPISVAVMGCVVNGPGEAKSADIGIACGKGNGVIFADGEVLRSKIPEEELVDALMEEIEARFL